MSAYHFFKSMAFRLDAETAHHQSIKFASRFPEASDLFWDHDNSGHKYNIKLKCGLSLSFPLGLAAGLDKNAECIDFFSRLLFGFVEVGTVTPKAQAGNPKPRLFRIKTQESLLNRMGFNNEGMDVFKNNLLGSRSNGKIVGANLGKNKVTSQEKAKEDYKVLYKELAPLVDYLVINVSSPNTPGLRSLQTKEALVEIIEHIAKEREHCPRPLFVKVSPDMNEQDYDDVVDVAKKTHLAGIIATNTSIMADWGQGGVSGALISDKAADVRNYLLSKTKDTNLDLIGVGGIKRPEDLFSFWERGGRAVQIYSSFIYQGPDILMSFKKEIDCYLKGKNKYSCGELFDEN